MYEYKAQILRVVDGDTFECLIDLGFDLTLRETVRLAGVDTPETFRPSSEEERAWGKEATEFVRNFMEGDSVLLKTEYRRGKYGRILARVWHPGHEQWLGEELTRRGLVKESEWDSDKP